MIAKERKKVKQLSYNDYNAHTQ